jgi:hypothetical protein
MECQTCAGKIGVESAYASKSSSIAEMDEGKDREALVI